MSIPCEPCRTNEPHSIRVVFVRVSGETCACYVRTHFRLHFYKEKRTRLLLWLVWLLMNSIKPAGRGYSKHRSRLSPSSYFRYRSLYLLSLVLALGLQCELLCVTESSTDFLFPPRLLLWVASRIRPFTNQDALPSRYVLLLLETCHVPRSNVDKADAVCGSARYSGGHCFSIK